MSFEDDCTENAAKTGSFEDDCTENIAKAGILEENVKKTQTFCRVGARVHWMEVLQIVTWGGRKNTYTILVACFYASVCAMAFASLRQSIFEKLFMVELREIRVIIARNNF